PPVSGKSLLPNVPFMPRSEDSTGAYDRVHSEMLYNSEELNMMYDSYENGMGFGVNSPAVNVGERERVASVAGGVALMSVAVFKRGPLSIPALFSGLVLLLRGLTGICPAYKTLGISTAEDADYRHSENVSVPAETGIHVVRAVTINRPAEDLYNFWRNPANLPSVMKYVDS